MRGRVGVTILSQESSFRHDRVQADASTPTPAPVPTHPSESETLPLVTRRPRIHHTRSTTGRSGTGSERKEIYSKQLLRPLFRRRHTPNVWVYIQVVRHRKDSVHIILTGQEEVETPFTQRSRPTSSTDGPVRGGIPEMFLR